MNIVFVDSINSARQVMSSSYDAFPKLLADELMPQLAEMGIQAPASHTIIAGSSYGGLGRHGMRYSILKFSVMSLACQDLIGGLRRIKTLNG